MQNIGFLGSWKPLMRLIDSCLRSANSLASGICQAIFFFAVLFPSSVGAQSAAVMYIDNTTQTPIFGIGHDYIQDLSEIVNPANGSLSIRVQAPTPQDRGWHDPTYAMSYDSTGQLQFLPTYIPDPTAVVGSPDGYDVLYSVNIQYLPNPFGAPIVQGQPYYQGISSEIVDGPLMYQTGTITEPACSGCAESYICTYGSNFVFTDSSGGLHSLPIRTNLPPPQEAQTIPNCGVFNMGPISQGGDGLYTAFYNSTTSTVYVLDNHGDVVASTGNSPVPAEDTNGNYRNGTGRTYGISFTSSNGKNYVSSVTVPGLGAPYRYTYPTLTDLPKGGFTLNPVLNTAQSSPQVGSRPGCPSSFVTNSYGATSSGSETLTLPNGQAYTFGFDSAAGTGNISSIKYPTGAKVTYTWGSNPQSNTVEFHEVAGAISSSYCFYTYDYPAIQSRIVSYDGVNEDIEQDFQYVNNWNPASGQPWKQTTVTTTDLKSPGKPSYQTIYTYTQGPGPLVPPGNWGDEELVSPVPMESSIVYKGTSGETLKTVQKSWTGNNQLGAQCTTIGSNTAGVFYKYVGGTALVSDEAEYDYGLVSSSCQRPSGTPTRETATTYQSFGTTALLSVSPSILDRLCSTIVYGNGVKVGETDYFYDGASTANVCGAAGTPSVALVSPSAINHDETNYSHTSPSPRGNLTAVIQRCLQGCSDSLTQYSYDETGQVVSITDPDNHPPTTYSYADNYGSGDGSPAGNTNTYVKTVTRPSTNGTTHTTTYSWGFKDGKMRSSTDVENATTTTYCYFTGGCAGNTMDPWARLTGISSPDGGITVQSYSDAGPNPYTITTTKLNGSESTIKYTISDAYGHPIQTQTSAPNGADVVNLVYDGFGRVYTATNPFLSSSQPSSSLVSTPAGTPLTTHYYDALGRSIETVEQDGISKLQWCYNGISSSSGVTICSSQLGSANTGTWVDSSDEVGNHWQRTSDSFGRLTKVMEPNGTAQAPSMETDYGYNALNDLLSVTQWGGAKGSSGAISRSFAYDSLSRLTQAFNPEVGWVCYGTTPSNAPANGSNCTEGYDPNGNMTAKTDARGIKTAYTYDAVNRLTQKTYSDGTTLPALFGYDSENITMGTSKFTTRNVVGRPSWTCVLNAAGNGCSVMEAFSYDPMGRVVQEWLSTPPYVASPAAYTTTYSYDLAGDRISLGNSTGRTFNYTYDTAGRLQTAAHTASINGTAVTTPMVSSVNYFASGQPQTMTTNSGSATVTGTWGLDNRMRVNSYVNLSTANSGNTNYGYTLTYYPNSNIQTAAETVYDPGMGAKSWSWTYNYDTLNRLANAKSSGAILYGCQETYDAWGNRTAQAPYGGPGYSCTSPTTPVTAGNNRLSGYTYDVAGNLLNDGSNTLTYDAEGRITTSYSPIFGVTSSYIYDAGGQRVSKIFGSYETDYVHDPGGALLATYVNGSYFGNFQDMWIGGEHFGEVVVAAGNASQTQNFSLTNWVGSQAAYTNSSTGIPTAAYLSQPFGDAQTTLFGSNNDDIHFTGKERDGESGNDYFGARYYASSMGRFLSPDDPVDQHPADPQSWNLYSYVRNNPLILTDPTGDYACGTYVSAAQCTAFGNMLTQAQSVLDKAKAAGTIDSDQYKTAEKALGAYGTLNDGNGVTVNVGATGGFPGTTVAEGGGEKTAANPTGQDIQVTLNGKLFDQGSSPALLGAIAHEGSHVEDAEAWAKAGFTAAANPSNFKTEFAAYGVTITMAQAQGSTSLSGTKPGGNTSMMFWNNSKSWMENQSMRGNMIRNFYPAWKLKAFGENTKGSGWGTK